MSDTVGKYDVEATLCFFYFGLTPDELKDVSRPDSYLKKVINKALFDATMQGAFNTKVSLDDKDEAYTAKQNAVNCLVERIKNLESFKQQTQYDKWHHDTCRCLLCKFGTIQEKDKPDKAIFSYGNAQKVVNMSMKYLYMLSCSEFAVENKEVLENVKTIKSFLHMPIDSYIIDQLYINNILEVDSECDGTEMMSLLQRENKSLPKTKSLKDCSHPSEYIKPWSQWDYNVYEKVQNIIRIKMPEGNEYYVIDWENDLWIERVKNKRT